MFEWVSKGCCEGCVVKQKEAYVRSAGLVGSDMSIRDRCIVIVG